MRVRAWSIGGALRRRAEIRRDGIDLRIDYLQFGGTLLFPEQSERFARLRACYAEWSAGMPPVPEDARVSLIYTDKDMP